jgi:hypothetical protein
MNVKYTILITGARAPIALELARSMAAAGHKVIMGDCQRFTVARWTNTIAKYVLFPSPGLATKAFVAALQQTIETEHVDHLIPTCEEAFYISRYKESFSCKVWTAPFGLMNELHNKWTFIQMAKSYFTIPQTREASVFNDWDNCDQYVFKKKYSRFGTSVIIGGCEQECAEVKACLHDWIVQEKIQGTEVCVYSVWDEGKLKAFACYHPLYRYGKGAGIFFEPVKNEKIRNSVKAIGAAICYHGQLSFDIIIKDEIPYVLECNPRGTSGAHLLNRSLAAAFFESGTVPENLNGDYCIAYAMLLKHPLRYFRKRERRAKDVICSPTDLAPFFLQALSILEILYLKITRNQTLLQATTGDIEWNGGEC